MAPDRTGLVVLGVALIAAVAAMLFRLRQRARALETEVALLNQTLASTRAIPWKMIPGTQRFAHVGPQATHVTGHTVAAWTSARFLEEHVHPADRDKVTRALASFEATGAGGVVELRLARADGAEIALRAIVEAVRDASGRAVLHGIFLDVTAERMLEAELRGAQKLESLGRLSAGIAHEINTPVQFVADSVHYIKEAFTSMVDLVRVYRGATADGLAEREREARAEMARSADALADTDYALENIPAALDSALEGLERIAVIVRSLKDFSRPDSPNKAAIDLNASIVSTIAIATNEYEHVAELATDLGEIGPVVCHGGEIHQVVLDLIVNAAHAIGDVVATTNRRGRIEIVTWQELGWVNVTIKDTGNGIPPEIQDKIFDPFFTTKEVGRGTGQGLALARRIVVDKHGGELTFESEPGKGTAFTLKLPCERPSLAEVA